MIRGPLAERVARLSAAREAFVEATVVRAVRPTSVRPGDPAIVLADGTIEGFVGGVCAEQAVRLHALRALETGEPLLLRLVPEPEAAADAARAACAGGADPAKEPAEGAAAAGPTAGAVAEGAVVERNPCLSGGALEIFLEPCLPPPRLVVIGDAPVAHALALLAADAGFAVAGGGARSGRGAPQDAAARPRPDDPDAAGLAPASGDAALVVASHGRDEEAALATALRAGVGYVGLVASARRGAAVRAALDVPDELRAQLHTPAGLPIGARTPAEIALAILAEIVAERRGASGPPVADRPPAAAHGPGCPHHAH